ncbi:hypothetical protein BD779DRAFT_1477423 [Infundibulicybe gibba]|nr:hypothetical protein BD779DRAFT_1477423 [Infundibulicybe gibba]
MDDHKSQASGCKSLEDQASQGSDESQPAGSTDPKAETNQSIRDASRARKRRAKRHDKGSAARQVPIEKRARQIRREAAQKAQSAKLWMTKRLLKTLATEINTANRVGKTIPSLSPSTHIARWSDDKPQSILSQFRQAFTENNKYRLFVRMDYHADWYKAVRVTSLSNAAQVLCEFTIDPGQLFLIAWSPRRISGSLSQDPGSIPRRFRATCSHLRCISVASFRHLILRDPDTTPRAAGNLFIHPNVGRAGWAEFMAQAEAIDVEPPFWKLTKLHLMAYITLSPPQVFLDWADAIEGGEKLDFMPGEPIGTRVEPQPTIEHPWKINSGERCWPAKIGVSNTGGDRHIPLRTAPINITKTFQNEEWDSKALQ